MKIVKLETGFLKENCYLIKDEINKECIIVDPGADFISIKEKINDYRVLKVLLTHNHFDHIGALEEILNEYKVDVLKKDNLEEKEYKLNNFNFKVIQTPGHTNDSVTYYFEKERIMFTGDFLFKDTIGRTDLPTGNALAMWESLNLIKTYPKDITICPGHGDMSTLENEFKNNIYFS
jgi:glyoxylase-like metal-dependent hydrolase (beta-lactamase superfamily II)